MRGAGLLVASEHDGGDILLWVFRTRGKLSDESGEPQSGLDSEGQLSPSTLAEPLDHVSQTETTKPRQMFYVALSAFVQRGLDLTSRVSAIDFLTWIVMPQFGPVPSDWTPRTDSNLIVSLTLQTTANGALACLTEVNPTHLSLASHYLLRRPLSNGMIDLPLILVPLGLSAICVRQVASGDQENWLPEAASWFYKQYPFLSLKELAQSTNWMIVKQQSRLLRDAPESDTESFDSTNSLLWPACLCMLRRSGVIDIGDIPDGFLQAGAEASNYEDPFRKAEEWYLAKAERETAFESAKLGAVPLYDPSSQILEDDLESATSPLYLRHIDSGNSNAVYPTPPDGIAPGPSHVAPQTTQIADETMLDDEPSRSERHGEDDVATVQPPDRDNADDDGDLFGDIEGDTFGNPDITDADFNFFDETVAAKLAMSSRMNSEKRVSVRDQNQVAHAPNCDVKMADMPTFDPDARNSSSDLNGSKDVRSGTAAILQIQTENFLGEGGERAHAPQTLSPQCGVATPPLSPLIVKDRLFSLGYFPTSQDSNNGDHHFTPVTFRDEANVADSKYSNGGKFGTLTNGTSAGYTLSSSKRSISLRDFLGQQKANEQASSASVIGRLIRHRLLNNDSDDSDTESTITNHSGLMRKVRPRIMYDTDAQDIEMEDGKVNKVVERRQDLRPKLNQSQMIRKEWAKVSDSASTSTDTWDPYNIAVITQLLAEQPEESRTSLWDMFDFDGPDIIEVAQILAANAAISYDKSSEFYTDTFDGWNSLKIERDRSTASITKLSQTKALSLSSLAATSMAPTVVTATEASSQNIPRPTPKRSATVHGSSAFGQQLFPLHSPYVRLRRTDATWEMLPSAVAFWEVLGLEPIHGPKDIVADLVMVGSEDFRDSCLVFFRDMQYCYETCKLGQHDLGFKIHRKAPASNSGSPNDTPARMLLSAFKNALLDLSKKMNQRSRQHSSRPSVIYLFVPFRDASMSKYVCACYWLFLKELVPEAKNVVLHMVSLEQVICQDDTTTIKSQLLIQSARTLYDKVDLRRADGTQDFWKISNSPSIALVSPIPRKINFSMSETPPLSLLQEASVLHLAYGISADGRWLNAAWTDYTGNHQKRCAFCLYKADYRSVLSRVKDYTKTLLSPSTTWRLIVAFTGNLPQADRQAWTSLAAAQIAVAIVEVCLSPTVQVFPRSDPTEFPMLASNTPIIPQTSSLTPVSTPQAASTVSPDAHHPMTPTSTDQSNIPEADPDAHLIDIRDESYALVLCLSATRPRRSVPEQEHSAIKPLASGLLLKRGTATPNRPLPAFGVDVVALAPPRLAQGQSNWMMPRSPEYVLREVLTWYRGLALLGKLRGIPGCEAGEVPWHVGVVLQSGKALEGFFD
ncbi:hypothetical protein ANO11243_078210 [Dothideomycetidae sp. 11243]|nr:hypothetical protein ANO11243_078210 [fungal sp. No.11243]